MLRWMVLQFIVVIVCCACAEAGAAAAGTPGLESITAKESQHHRRQQQVSSWLPFSQWSWLNSILSLREKRIDEEESSHSNLPRENNNNPAASAKDAEDDSMLSLVLLLNQSDEGRTRNEASTRLPSPPPPPPPAFAKRSRPSCLDQGKGSRCRRGKVSTITAADARRELLQNYVSVPKNLIQFSQQQAEDTACNDLSVQLFRVDLKEHYLEPVWVREIVHLGMCPSKLQTRYFGEEVWPSSVVETKCLCHHKTCSNLGGDFRCQAVKRPIQTWVRNGEKFLPMPEMITVGCVCVQRTSPEGKYAGPAIES